MMTENSRSTKTTKPVAKKSPTTSKKVPAKTAATKPETKLKKNKKDETKVKVVRDSFTMPQADYDIIGALKQKALKAGLSVKKSELLRAGVHALDKLNITQLKQAIANLEKIKTGRPKKA